MLLRMQLTITMKHAVRDANEECLSTLFRRLMMQLWTLEDALEDAMEYVLKSVIQDTFENAIEIIIKNAIAILVRCWGYFRGNQ